MKRCCKNCKNKNRASQNYVFCHAFWSRQWVWFWCSLYEEVDDESQ